MRSKHQSYTIISTKVIIALLLCLFSCSILQAQNQKIDSLLTLLKTDKADTTKVKHLNAVAWLIKSQNPDTAILLSSQALDIIKDLSPYLKIQETENFQSRLYSNIGVYHSIKSDYPRALEYYLKSLNLAEKLNNKRLIAISLNNIGPLYDQLGNQAKALDCYFKTLKIKEELKDKRGMINVLGNIGTLYSKQFDHSKALIYFSEALKIAEEMGDTEGQARNLGSLGITFLGEKDYDKALAYFEKSLTLNKELGNDLGMASTLANVGALYTLMGKYTEAEEYYKKSIAKSEKTGAIESLMNSEDGLSQLYDTIAHKAFVRAEFSLAAKNYKNSILHFKKAITLKDSIYSQESKKGLVQKEMNYEFDKKEAATKAENDKQQALAEERNRKQKIISWTTAGGLILMLVFSVFMFRSLQLTRKQKNTIESQKNEVLKQKEIADNQRIIAERLKEDAENQKKVIEEKNKDITDSIHYAKRIQNALIREEEHVSAHLPEHFILFLPKDIVSGDFYWGAEKQEYWYFAVADCTGHGVPGAIMSMLGISFLNDIVLPENVLSPAEILNRLRDRVVADLRQTDETIGNKDGMDISMCRLNLKTLELHWAGANNPLNIVHAADNESAEAQQVKIKEIKGDKQPIGYHPDAHPFTNHVVQLKKGDCIYIYSDGYADQFGGPDGKKLKNRQFAARFVKDYRLPMNQQKQIFKKYFIDWKGSLDQVDDVCVFGIRV